MPLEYWITRKRVMTVEGVASRSEVVIASHRARIRATRWLAMTTKHGCAISPRRT
jgi:hypothetical protein